MDQRWRGRGSSCGLRLPPFSAAVTGGQQPPPATGCWALNHISPLQATVDIERRQRQPLEFPFQCAMPYFYQLQLLHTANMSQARYPWPWKNPSVIMRSSGMYILSFHNENAFMPIGFPNFHLTVRYACPRVYTDGHPSGSFRDVSAAEGILLSITHLVPRPTF